ncbi:hypothetical protein NIES2104_33220 [Leptolyngbya sp. NIES-2104]|nr:hypothetical protein NIES2104_33220 [Leptolyngbya sp. NIES-2104]
MNCFDDSFFSCHEEISIAICFYFRLDRAFSLFYEWIGQHFLFIL